MILKRCINKTIMRKSFIFMSLLMHKQLGRHRHPVLDNMGAMYGIYSTTPSGRLSDSLQGFLSYIKGIYYTWARMNEFKARQHFSKPKYVHNFQTFQ